MNQNSLLSIKPIKFLLILFFTLFSVFFFILSQPVNAQGPIPPPPTIDCDDTDNPEFHSLRPYQSSPCQKNIVEPALFCGNSLVLGDTVSGTCAAGSTCSFSVTQTKTFAINLSNAEFPILGNTEDVKNSQSPDEGLSETEKINEYVSWYLSGVPYKAETGLLDTYSKEGKNTLINYSGPLNKLLPLTKIHEYKTNTIEEAKVERHDQIVVCSKKGINIRFKSLTDVLPNVLDYFPPVALFNFLTDYDAVIPTLEIGDIPQDCYDGDGSRASGEMRLSDWKGQFLLPSISDAVSNVVIDAAASIFKDLPKETLKKLFANKWKEKTPPLERDFKNNRLGYQKALNEWRGKVCAIIPIPYLDTLILGKELEFLYCMENILIPNKYADFFPYVPLSSTEDLKGEVSVENVYVSGGKDVKISNVSSLSESSDLFFAHIEETVGLAGILQETFTPKDGISGSYTSPAFGPPSSCNLTNIRTNPGDALFPGEITGSVTYTADFSCDNDGTESIVCTENIGISLGTKTTTPKADEVWDRLVAGPGSIFRRMFPKVGEGGAIAGILDIPASTNITYDGASTQGADAEIYFPHIGGVQEYFLKGIQTILRPKGYGEQILSGQTYATEACKSGSSGTLPRLPAAKGSCKLSGPGSFGLPNELIKIIEAAAETYRVPPALIVGVMYGEGAFNLGKFDWSDEFVKKYSRSCAVLPSCNPNTWPSEGVFPFFEIYWTNSKDAVSAVDPNRAPNPCNIMDSVFAAAKDLSSGQYGGGTFDEKTCFGINLNTGSSSSNGCSWQKEDIETAIKVWETGYTEWCLTKEGSCLTGGGLSAACSDGDSCETINNRLPESSHNACIWDTYQSYK